MVAHAVYIGSMASSACSAKCSVRSLAAAVAIAGHVVGGAAAERAAGSIGRSTAMTVAEATTHRGVVAATRRVTVAVVHRRIVSAVAIVVAIIVAPASVVMSIVIASMVSVAMAPGRVGLVEVMTGIVAVAPDAVATLEGHEHCRTVEEHPSDTIAAVDAECPASGAPGERTVEMHAGHVAVVLPGAEHIAQVAVAHLPPESEHVGAGIYIEQVVEVDLIHCLILCICQAELVGHLV